MCCISPVISGTLVLKEPWRVHRVDRISSLNPNALARDFEIHQVITPATRRRYIKDESALGISRFASRPDRSPAWSLNSISDCDSIPPPDCSNRCRDPDNSRSHPRRASRRNPLFSKPIGIFPSFLDRNHFPGVRPDSEKKCSHGLQSQLDLPGER
jgi:hypothetical protein